MAATITSIKDERVVRVRALASRADRERERRCVIEGAPLIEQVLDAGSRIEFLLTAPGALPAARHDVPRWTATPAVLRQALRTQRPVDAIAVAELPPADDPDRDYGDLAVVLDGVVDPGNLGTIVRTACAFGATDVVCTDPATDLSSRRVLDSSRGAVLRAAVRRFGTPLAAMRNLRGHGFEIVGGSPRGAVPELLAPLSGGPVALVVGNETVGVRPDVLAACDHVVRIPMAGGVESLNVGVATGVSLAELRLRQAAGRALDPGQRQSLDRLLARILPG